MKIPFSFALAAALLAGCMSRATQPSGDFMVAPEKLVFLALKAASARDDQRIKVMAAYDVVRPKLNALYKEGQDLIEEWRGLDRRTLEFAPKAERIGTRLGEIAQERVAAMAGYEAAVAAILDAEQWEIWQNFWDDLVRAQEPRRR